MPENTNRQKPATLNQIEVNTPNVPRSFNLLEGPLAGSMNAGHHRTIALREAMAGERIAIEGAQLYIQLMTPRTPAYQKLIAVVKAYAVPHVRVFKNYYKFKAQNGGTSEQKIEYLPNFSEYDFLTKEFTIENTDYQVSIQETTLWRDNIYSCYIARVNAGQILNQTETGAFTATKMPPMDALGARGWTAIWNDQIRNKEYEEERKEYNGDTVTYEEYQSYFFDGVNDRDFYTARARRNNSYYTNYRTELQGFDLQPEVSAGENNFAMNWASFESAFNEARSQAENAQMNPWDVAQKLNGAKKLTEGRVQLIGERTFPINYSAITQNAYNNNDQIEDKYRVMGMQGAYSYTEIDLAFLNGIEITEDCYIHVVMSIVAETVFESAVNRQFCNIKWDDRYRPNLKDDKLDVIYNYEFGTPWAMYGQENYTKIVGFKRRFTEYFKLPTCLNGDIYNRGYLQAEPNGSINTTTRIIPNNTYQFFEFAGQKFQEMEYQGDGLLDKKIWLDYTDVALNKNLAIRQNMTYPNESGFTIAGPHQIIYFGTHYCLTDMPIEENIKNGFTKWGEH